MKLTRPFAMVEKDVLFSPELTALEKLVYCVLCAFSDNNTRSCYPSYNTIAEKVGCSKKTAIQCVASLCEKGWMQKMEQRTKKGGHRSNLYFLALSTEKQYLYPAHVKPETTSASEKSVAHALSISERHLAYIYVPSSYSATDKKHQHL